MRSWGFFLGIPSVFPENDLGIIPTNAAWTSAQDFGSIAFLTNKGSTVTTVLVETPPTAPPEPKSKKNSTAHLKAIPETRQLRDQIRDAAHQFVKRLDRSKPLVRDDGKR
jgi:hypothetical protein